MLRSTAASTISDVLAHAAVLTGLMATVMETHPTQQQKKKRNPDKKTSDSVRIEKNTNPSRSSSTEAVQSEASLKTRGSTLARENSLQNRDGSHDRRENVVSAPFFTVTLDEVGRDDHVHRKRSKPPNKRNCIISQATVLVVLEKQNHAPSKPAYNAPTSSAPSISDTQIPTVNCQIPCGE